MDKVIGVDPCTKSWELAAERARGASVDIDLSGVEAESIPLNDASVDSILITFTLCTVPNPEAALAEARRTLKPDGNFFSVSTGLRPTKMLPNGSDE